MVLRVVDRPWLTDRVEHHEVVLAAGGNAVDDDVGDRHMRCGQGLFGVDLIGLGGLHLLRERLGLCQQPRALVLARSAHLLAGGLLFGAKIVRGRDRGPARRVGFEQGVDETRILSAGTLRGTHHVGVLTQQLEVDHGRYPTGAMPPSGTTP